MCAEVSVLTEYGFPFLIMAPKSVWGLRNRSEVGNRSWGVGNRSQVRNRTRGSDILVIGNRSAESDFRQTSEIGPSVRNPTGSLFVMRPVVTRSQNPTQTDISDLTP